MLFELTRWHTTPHLYLGYESEGVTSFGGKFIHIIKLILWSWILIMPTMSVANGQSNHTCIYSMALEQYVLLCAQWSMVYISLHKLLFIQSRYLILIICGVLVLLKVKWSSIMGLPAWKDLWLSEKKMFRETGWAVLWTTSNLLLLKRSSGPKTGLLKGL